MRGKARILSANAIVVILLMSVIIAFSPVQMSAAQEIAREEIYIHSSAWGPPPGWNPLLPNTCWMYDMMYPTLYLYSMWSDEWIPYLAESYEWVDKYTILVHIRDEAEWWDGEPITAEDVKYSMELGTKYVDPMYAPLWTYIESVIAVDEKTVAFVTSEEKLNYLNLLNVLWVPLVLPKHIWEGYEAEYGAKLSTEFRNDVPEEIVGGGPYKLMSWTEEAYYYERVDDWWGKDTFGVPNMKYICHKDFKDNVAAALAFEAGDLDVMTHFTPDIWKIWEEKLLARRTYFAGPPYYLSNGVNGLFINCLVEPLADPTVRRAIAYSLDLDSMIEKAYCNYGAKAVPVPIMHTTPAVAWIDEDLVEQYGWEFDIDKANQILDDAGIVDTNGDGTREINGVELSGFTIQVPYGWTDWMMMCDMITTNLAEIGIGCTTEFPDFSVWWSRLTDKTWDFVIGWTAGPGFAHPWNVIRVSMDNRLSHPAGNWENYDNPEATALIDAIPKESNAEVLKGVYSELQEIFLKDIPFIPMFYGATWYEYSEEYWVGWPNEENGFWFAAFFGGSWPENMPCLFTVVPKGQTPVQPSWVTETKFPTSEIFAALAGAPTIPRVVRTLTTTTTTTETETKTATTTTTATTTSVTTQITTTERTVPTMDVTSVAGAGVVALIVGVVVGWLVASRKR